MSSNAERLNNAIVTLDKVARGTEFEARATALARVWQNHFWSRPWRTLVPGLQGWALERYGEYYGRLRSMMPPDLARKVPSVADIFPSGSGFAAAFDDQFQSSWEGLYSSAEGIREATKIWGPRLGGLAVLALLGCAWWWTRKK